MLQPEKQTNHFFVERVAVLGAGVMGAQIAAQFVNAGKTVLLFDLAATGNDQNKNAIVLRAIKALQTVNPKPLAEVSLSEFLLPANYEEDLPKLKTCDLVIEAISERLDWKTDLYRKISPFLGDKTFIATNTSGLSIETLSETLTPSQQTRFCGMHFFNPPRYMSLVELIPNTKSDQNFLSVIETFLVRMLGKNVIHAKDTPNFIANRIGVFYLLLAAKHAERFGLSPDLVDAITGTLIGRPKSAIFRTLDIIGLDTYSQAVNTLATGLPHDPWHAFYQLPQWLTELVQKGALGQKTKMGVYKKQNDQIYVIDTKQANQAVYHLAQAYVPEELLAIFAIRDPKERFIKLKESTLPEAKFLLACFRDLLHYTAFHLESIADSARDVDLAIRWGYAWEQGPFEEWQRAGFQEIALWLAEEIKQGQCLVNAALPAWVNAREKQGVYTEQGAFSPSKNRTVPRSSLKVYQRQLFPETVLNEKIDFGSTVFETDAVRVFTRGHDELAILSFKTKANTINEGVLEGIQEAIVKAEAGFQGLILWQQDGKDFSFGANLKMVLEALQNHEMERLSRVVALFQETALALRYSKVPTIAAVRGLVLGGACELMMHCTRTVAAMESYIGLVETGVGILPAGAGTKEMALRASKAAKELAKESVIVNDTFPLLQNYFKNIGRAVVSTSALHAKQLDYLRTSDVVVMHPREILYVAKNEAIALSEANYCPPRPEKIIAMGKSGWATLQAGLANMREGHFISDHDYDIGCRIAYVLCGGEIEEGTQVSEEWFLRLEHQAFMDLLQTQKTQDRIAYMLQHGKPLRN